MKPTIEQIIEEVKRLCREKPDNVYQRLDGDALACYYDKGCTQDGEIGCIFGQAFRNLGYSIVGSIGICNKLDNQNILYYEWQGNWCRRLQDLQDSGMSWGKCLQAVESHDA